MTAIAHYTIHCDTEGCTSSHTPPPGNGASVHQARAHASHSGWSRPHPHRGPVDRCPHCSRADRRAKR